MRNNIEIGEDVYRYELGNFTALYDGKEDKLLLGFINADKMSFTDLEHIQHMLTKMIKKIREDEELKNSKH